MRITFLGTTCMVPTKERNHTSILLRFKSEGILVDCGEGTQRQIKIANHKLTEITKVLITHWHGDHTLGIPGLIQSLGASQYSGTLHIYGPKGTKEYMENMLRAFVFDNKVDIRIFEIKEGKFFENEDYALEAYELEHGVTTLGYRFIEKDRRRINLNFTQKKGIPEGPLLGKLQKGKDITFNEEKILADDATYIVKGKKVAFMFDTTQCKNCLKLARDVDILISDSSFDSSYDDKAELRKHLTAGQAASIASQAGVGQLILTHFSTRYKDTSTLEEEAAKIFPNVRSAYDFLKIRL